MTILRIGVSGAFCLVLIAATSRADSPNPKASRACRKAIGSSFSNIVKAGIGVIDACHALRDKDKFTGDCNDLTVADLKGKLAAAHTKAMTTVGKKCVSGEPVLDNYPSHDPVGAFFPLAVDVLQASGNALLGSPDIHNVKADKAKAKCHGQVAKAAAKDILEIVGGAVKCQNGIDKTAMQFGSLQSDCLLASSKAGPKGELAIGKACVDAGVGSSDVGSCDPLPTCVTTAASTTGRQASAAIYNPTPGCGNSFVEPGEECDDGNDSTHDGCIACKLATCGDGFVHAGVELCGDSTTEACTNPNESTCGPITPCTPDGQTKTVTVRFAKPATTNVLGLSIALDYPETNVRIPGTGSVPSVTQRVTVVPSGLATIVDRDYEIEVTVVSDAPMTPGDFFTVQLDECSPPTPDQFACIVRSAGDGVNDVTNKVTCSVVVL